ncbi:MAG: metallophosphoesterase family protein [Nitrososphaerales archaeon]
MSLDIILVADIHSNLEALKAVSKDMPRLPIYCVGDFVGYGANPNEVIQWAKERDVKAVMGNHDYATVTGDTEWFNSGAAAAIEWTRRQIGASEKKYLSSLPRSRVLNIGGLKMLMVHGSPTEPLFEYVHPATHEYLFNAYLKRFKVDIIAMGHTHIPFVWEGKKGAVVNPGSVGQPRSGNPDASYLIVRVEDRRVEFEHRPTPYDTKAAAEKIKNAGLPIFLAERLYRGV